MFRKKKKSPSDELFLHFSFESSESDRVFNYLHDSNSIFRAQGINSEWVFGGTVVERKACPLAGWVQGSRTRKAVTFCVEWDCALHGAEWLEKGLVVPRRRARIAGAVRAGRGAGRQ